MTDTHTQKIKIQKKKANKEPHIPPTHSTFFKSANFSFFLLLLLIFLFSSYLFLVSYDEDEVGVELGFFWLTKSE